jgi:hypothetical protein
VSVNAPTAVLAGQALWPATFLVLAGVGKALELGRESRNTLLANLRPAWMPLSAASAGLAGVELLVGGLLLVGAFEPWPQIAAAALLGGAALVAFWGMRHLPTAGCGCMGGLAHGSVTWMTVLRAGLLSVMALLAAVTSRDWTQIVEQPVGIAVVVLEGAALVWLSPDLRSMRLSNAVRRVCAGGCRGRAMNFESAVAELRSNRIWDLARPYLTNQEPEEHWQTGCWRFFSFQARYAELASTAVCALYVGRCGGRSSVVFVDAEADEVLGQLPLAVPRRDRPQHKWRRARQSRVRKPEASREDGR